VTSSLTSEARPYPPDFPAYHGDPGRGGRVEDAQVAVDLVDASNAGHALADWDR
jgi:hypothetical protein